MSEPAATLEWLLRPSSNATGIDRQVLAGLLVELARHVGPSQGLPTGGILPIDPRLEQLRVLLLGREIEVLSRLSEVVEDPEQLAAAVGRVLPAAIAQASSDARLGQVLAPALEKATQTSIRSDPRTLINILYPLIVPAIRKSIGEMIDETFQALNETLKHSLSWRGLKWRWEAWRTGTTFTAVVLRHTLVYRIEHVFLIHRHTGLLIAHAAAKDAASQDPQLVSSMLVAIQDFVHDSFSGADRQGLDTLRLGELRLWSEPGPFATLVAVIRGNPPEGLHERLREVLASIHHDRPQALEDFSGDSSSFADVEAQLTECAALRQAAQESSRGSPWRVALVAGLLLLLGMAWGLQRWHSSMLWNHYVERLQAQPGIVVTQTGRHGRKFSIAGLRDPLAADPQQLLRDSKLDPTRVIAHWAPYQALDPELVLARLRVSLDPPPSVTLAVVGNHIAATGSAPSLWLARARAVSRALPAGASGFDFSGVRDVGDGAIGKLRAAIESQQVRFNNNEPLPPPEENVVLDRLAAQLDELAQLSAAVHETTRVTVIGHSDATGGGTFNLSLSLARAEAVRALLKQRGIDPDLLAVRGAGPLEPLEAETSDAARSINRRASFTVEFEDQQ